MDHPADKKFGLGKIIPSGLGRFDLVVTVIIYLACYLLFCFNDIFITAGFAHTYLKGHIFDFYQYNVTAYHIAGVEYLHPIYIIFAIWLLPLNILGLLTPITEIPCPLSVIETAWLKLLLVLAVALCARVIYKIACVISNHNDKAKLISWLFLSNPITIYCALIFSGYDIFGLLFTMIGLYYFLKRRHSMFLLFFALAIPFKFFAVIPFLPLLLLVRKNFWQLVLDTLLAASFSMILIGCTLFDKGSTVFRIVIANNTESNALGVFMHPSFEFLGLIVVCFVAYLTRCGNDEGKFASSAIFLPLAALVCVFTFILWHPQWLIILIPWFSLAYISYRNLSYALLFDTAGIASLFIKILDQWDRCDFQLLGNGVLRHLFRPEYIAASRFIPVQIVPFLDTFILLFFISPFLILYLEKRNINLPEIGLFKNEYNYLRLRNYGGILLYLSAVLGIVALVTVFPQIMENTASMRDTILQILGGGMWQGR
jgi:hypothetical protein